MEFLTIANLRATLEGCKKDYQAAIAEYAASHREAMAAYEKADHFDFGALERARRLVDLAEKTYTSRTIEQRQRVCDAVADLDKEIRGAQIEESERLPQQQRKQKIPPLQIAALDALKKAAFGLFRFEPCIGEQKTIHGTPFWVPCDSPEQQAAEAAIEKLIEETERALKTIFP